MLTLTMTRISESSAPSTCLLLPFELGQRSWKLGFTVGIGQRPRVRHIAARAVGALANEIVRANARFDLPADAPVISCYEAGATASGCIAICWRRGSRITSWTRRALRSIGGHDARRPTASIWRAYSTS
jgi:hypothetical protein